MGTAGGHLYLRLRTAVGASERAGFPPGGTSGDSTVLSAVPLSGGGPGGATLAVVDDDRQVWL